MSIKFGGKSIKKYWLEIILISISVIVAIVSGLMFYYSKGDFSAENNGLSNKNPVQNIEKIYVDIAGYVENPGLYKASRGERLDSLIKKAGGLSNDADKVFFSQNFNLSEMVYDREKIYIPSVWEVRNGYSLNRTDGSSVKGDNNKIDINRATKEELETLPGIGQATSEKIIENRPYGALRQLIDRKCVNQKTYENIKDLVTF